MSVETFTPGENAPSKAEIIVTPAAQQHLADQLNEKPGMQGVRISVKTSGCSGYMYVLDFASEAGANDTLLELSEELTLFIDRDSLPMIAGTQIDYVTTGLNATIQFKNPNVTGECGCGESFTVG